MKGQKIFQRLFQTMGHKKLPEKSTAYLSGGKSKYVPENVPDTVPDNIPTKCQFWRSLEESHLEMFIHCDFVISTVLCLKA